MYTKQRAVSGGSSVITYKNCPWSMCSNDCFYRQSAVCKAFGSRNRTKDKGQRTVLVSMGVGGVFGELRQGTNLIKAHSNRTLCWMQQAVSKSCSTEAPETQTDNNGPATSPRDITVGHGGWGPKLEGSGRSEPEREVREQPSSHLYIQVGSVLHCRGKAHELKRNKKQSGAINHTSFQAATPSFQQQVFTWLRGVCFSPLTPRSTASSVLSFFISTTMLSLPDFSLVLQNQRKSLMQEPYALHTSTMPPKQ